MPKRTYTCGNCNWSTTDEGAMKPIRDFHKRHFPGDAVADGECPACESLCFADDNDDGPAKTKRLFLDSLAAWEDEEDSVKAEHAELIARMQAHAKELQWL